MSELAASRGVSKATPLADYRSSLQAHGEQAEDKLPKELSARLVKSAPAVDSNDARKDAWHALISGFDTPVLMNNLYPFTTSATSTGVLQDAYRFLREERPLA